MNENKNLIQKVPQDLHIHTVFSTGDSSIVPEQTVEFISKIKHADVVGISDHLDYMGDNIQEYMNEVKKHGLYAGTEVNGAQWVKQAVSIDFDYYIYHCYDNEEDYKGVELLLATGKPVIIAHPMVFDTKPGKLPNEVLIEINNRYVWRRDWQKYYTGIKDKFQFVIGSDCHQPNWLNQNIARYVAGMLNIQEKILFPDNNLVHADC